MLFSIQILKVLKIDFFQRLARLLVLANAFFYSNSNLKSIEKLIFPAFGKILVLADAFFDSNSNFEKVLKN